MWENMGNKQMFQCINVIFIMIVTNGSCILVHKYENMFMITCQFHFYFKMEIIKIFTFDNNDDNLDCINYLYIFWFDIESCVKICTCHFIKCKHVRLLWRYLKCYDYTLKIPNILWCILWFVGMHYGDLHNVIKQCCCISTSFTLKKTMIAYLWALLLH